jgi:hypothetical protein
VLLLVPSVCLPAFPHVRSSVYLPIPLPGRQPHAGGHCSNSEGNVGGASASSSVAGAGDGQAATDTQTDAQAAGVEDSLSSPLPAAGAGMTAAESQAVEPPARSASSSLLPSLADGDWVASPPGGFTSACLFFRASVCLSVYPWLTASGLPCHLVGSRLPVCLSMHLSVSPSAHPSNHASVRPSIHPTVCLPARPHVCLSTRLSDVRPFLHLPSCPPSRLPLHACPSVHPSSSPLTQSLHLWLCPSACLSAQQSLHLWVCSPIAIPCRHNHMALLHPARRLCPRPQGNSGPSDGVQRLREVASAPESSAAASATPAATCTSRSRASATACSEKRPLHRWEERAPSRPNGKIDWRSRSSRVFKGIP